MSKEFQELLLLNVASALNAGSHSTLSNLYRDYAQCALEIKC